MKKKIVASILIGVALVGIWMTYTSLSELSSISDDNYDSLDEDE